MKHRFSFKRDTLGKDSVAGLVLGVQSVPDGLATGLLAGVNPLSGLYAYLVGTMTGACFTSSAFMAVQGTGAMAMIVADVPAVHSASDPAGALFTLSVLTGVVMLAAGLLRLGSVLRFVSNAVMVGFINAVGVNIVLGAAGELHRLRRAGTEPDRPRFRHPGASRPAPSADRRGRGRHDRVDHPSRADQARVAGAGARGHPDLGCHCRPRGLMWPP